MNLRTYFAAILLLCLVGGCGGGTNGTGGVEIKGGVIGGSGEPLGGVIVDVRSSDDELLDSATSSTDGSFLIEDLQQGMVILEVDSSLNWRTRIPLVLTSEGGKDLQILAASTGFISSRFIEDSSLPATQVVTVVGRLDIDLPPLAVGALPGSPSTFSEIARLSQLQTVVDVFDDLGASHTLSVYFFRISSDEVLVRVYTTGGEVNPSTDSLNSPVQLGDDLLMRFDEDGKRSDSNEEFSPEISISVVWKEGGTNSDLGLNFSQFTQYDGLSVIQAIHVR